jgi:hypothetical protein
MADELMFTANNNLRTLVNMLKKENNGRDLSVYYNWLKEE